MIPLPAAPDRASRKPGINHSCRASHCVKEKRRAAEWQNSIRAAMKMELVETAHPLKVSVIALIKFVALLLLAQSFKLATSFLSGRIRRFIPRRIANFVGLFVAVLLIWSIANNLLVRAAFNALDSSFREFDALLEPERPQAGEARRTGSAASLVTWNELGRTGREFVVSGPTAAQIAHSGRLRAFRSHRHYSDGTGWIDPAAMDASSISPMTALPALPCSTPISTAHCRCRFNRNTARKPHEPYLPQFMDIGRRYRRIGAQDYTCMA